MSAEYVTPPMLPSQHRVATDVQSAGGGFRAACDWAGCSWDAPVRATVDLAGADLERHRSDLLVVLTDVDPAAGSLVALPLTLVAEQLGAFNTLLGARTFGEAREDPYAATLVEGWVQGWVEDEREVTGQRITGGNSDPFDAEELWGVDNWRVWRPDPLELQQFFLDIDAMDACLFLDAPFETALLVEESPPVVDPESRDGFEAAIAAYGWQVRRFPGLVGLFVSPPADAWAVLSSVR